MNNPEPAMIQAEFVRKSYALGRNTVEVLRGVSVGVHRGETLSIMGVSGAGKSTLLHLLGGLDKPSGGRVLFEGKDLYSLSQARRNEIRATKVGFVFQSFYLLPELDIVDNVMLPAMSRRGALRKSRDLRERARHLLDRVGLGHRAEHRPLELSGGEQQRVAIARALMNDPAVVLADEPTGNLDSQTGEQVLSSLFDLVDGGDRTLVVVTHNEHIAGLCRRQLILRDGCLDDRVV